MSVTWEYHPQDYSVLLTYASNSTQDVYIYEGLQFYEAE